MKTNNFPLQYQNDESVSAVISVILMVAITVIIAAIVATYAFGMAQSSTSAKVLMASISNVDANHIAVTYQGGQDQNSCVGIRWTLTSGSGATLTETMMGTTSPTASALSVGTIKVLSSSSSGKRHVIGTAYFRDNYQQVIFDSWVG